MVVLGLGLGSMCLIALEVVVEVLDGVEMKARDVVGEPSILNFLLFRTLFSFQSNLL